MHRLDERFSALLETGKQQGFLTFQQINEFLPDEGGDPAVVDHLVLMLEELQLEPRDVYLSPGPLGLADLFQLSGLSLHDLSDPPFSQATPTVFQGTFDAAAFFATLKERDVLVHHPYESFDTSVVEFIEAAAEDPAHTIAP